MANGFKYLRLWKKTHKHKLMRMPSPIRTALEIMKERYGFKALEDVMYMIIKRDPEAREIIRFALSGTTGVRFKGDPTIEEEIESED